MEQTNRSYQRPPEMKAYQDYSLRKYFGEMNSTVKRKGFLENLLEIFNF